MIRLIAFVAACALCACSPEERESSRAPASTPETAAGDDGAMADLKASPKWREPRCRWLKTGAWVLASSQETELYKAARDLRYIEMTEAGQENRVGVPQPAWKVTLTDAGKAESAACPGARSDNWGLPVSRREFVSATPAGKTFGGESIFDVEFTWVPTEAGDRVRHILTEYLSIEEGPSKARVTMAHGPRVAGAGGNGWAVLSIGDEPWRERHFKPRRD